MRLVTGAAILSGYRTVMMRIIGEQLFHVDKLFAVMVNNVVFAVALQAKLHRHLDEQVLDIGAMRIVAVDAFVALRERVVLDRRVQCCLFDLLMAAQTQRS